MKPTNKSISKAKGSSSQDDKEGIRSVSRLDIAQQRARTISMRLGTEVQTWEMRAAQPSETVLRQDRPVAMRVRWACHRCTDSMGSNGICSNCNHSRCKKCSRLHQHSEADSELVGMRPSRRRLAGDDEGFETSEPALTDYMLRKRSKTGGQDLVLRKPRHRVRRTCHVCKADFAQLSKICEKCQHVRCTDCPRDPAKQSKYPFGYPGDAFGPNSVPYYECAKCWALFPHDSENGTPCRRCGEKKSDSSPRAQPRAVDADYDTASLHKLEAKLAELDEEEVDHCLRQ